VSCSVMSGLSPATRVTVGVCHRRRRIRSCVGRRATWMIPLLLIISLQGNFHRVFCYVGLKTRNATPISTTQRMGRVIRRILVMRRAAEPR
jgi:hypothetical protein